MHRRDHDVAEALALLLAVAGRARVRGGALEVADRAGRVAGPEAKLPGKAERPGETTLVAELLEDAERLREQRSDLVVTGKRVREHSRCASATRASASTRRSPAVAEHVTRRRRGPRASAPSRLCPAARGRAPAGWPAGADRRGRTGSSARPSRLTAARRSPRPAARRPAAARRSAARFASVRPCSPAARAPSGSGRPVRGGSRPPRRARPGRPRARRSRSRSARGGRRASSSGARRTPRRGSAGGGSGRRPLPGSWARSGRTSSRRTSAVSGSRSSASDGESACTAPRWNTRPSTEPRSSTPRSVGSSWSRRAASSAWIVGGTVTAASGRVADEADHLLDEEWVALGRLEDARPRSSSPTSAPSSSAATSASASAAASGSSSTVVAFSLPPPQFGRRSRSSGRAMQSSRIGASRLRSATWSTRSRNASSPQWMSSSTTTSGVRSRRRLEQPADRPGDLLRRRLHAALPEQRLQRARRAAVEAELVEPPVGVAAEQLLEDLDDGPVGDALAVGEAGAADDRGRVQAVEELVATAATCRRRRRRAR